MKKMMMVSMMAVLVIAGNALALDMNQVKIHGFISQGWLKSDENNYLGRSERGSFQFNELGVNFSSQLTDELRMGIQFFSRDLGMIGNNEVTIDWAYADYRWRNWLGLRAGILRQENGFYNETRDTDMLRTCILLPQAVYGENQRDFYGQIQGVSVYGEVPMMFAGSLSYMFLIGTKNIDTDGAVSKFTEAGGRYEVTGYDAGIFYNGRLYWQTPVEGLRLGATLVRTTDLRSNLKTTVPIGKDPVGTPLILDFVEYYAYTLSVEYTWKNLKLVAEHYLSKNDREIGNSSTRLAYPFGCYGSASYRFNEWFELGSYYSFTYADRDDKAGEYFTARGLPEHRAWQKDFALSARFDINDYWTFKLEGHYINGTALLLPQENPVIDEKDWFLFAAKVTFSF